MNGFGEGCEPFPFFMPRSWGGGIGFPSLAQHPYNIPIGRNIFPRGIMGSPIIELGRAVDEGVIEQGIACSQYLHHDPMIEAGALGRDGNKIDGIGG